MYDLLCCRRHVLYKDQEKENKIRYIGSCKQDLTQLHEIDFKNENLGALKASLQGMWTSQIDKIN